MEEEEVTADDSEEDEAVRESRALTIVSSNSVASQHLQCVKKWSTYSSTAVDAGQEMDEDDAEAVMVSALGC